MPTINIPRKAPTRPALKDRRIRGRGVSSVKMLPTIGITPPASASTRDARHRPTTGTNLPADPSLIGCDPSTPPQQSAGPSSLEQIGGEGEQCDTAGPLDGPAQLALMTRAVTGNPSGNNLPSVRNEIPQSLRVLKIDHLDFIHTPLAHLLSSKAPSLFQHSSSPPLTVIALQNGTSSSPRGGSSS